MSFGDILYNMYQEPAKPHNLDIAAFQKMHLFTALAATCYNLYPLLPQPVQALRIAFEMEAPAEGDGMTTDLRRLYDITRSTQPAVQSSLPCGQACLWIGLMLGLHEPCPSGDRDKQVLLGWTHKAAQ